LREEVDSESDIGSDELDEASADANGEDTAGASRSRSLQRSIPSWDEAIGYIVESNMQSRSQRRQSSPAGPRGHSSRNRPRGRHKK
jgi:hypothetical protein